MKTEFEKHFPYDKIKYQGLIIFFDNMIRRRFLDLLEKISEGHSGMICETIGYNLSVDCDWVENGVELWWLSGLHDNSCNISYTLFVDSIEIASNIWLKNNMISLDDSIVEKVTDCTKKIRNLYLSFK